MEEEKLISNKELELAKKYVEYTNTNIFLTGKAGTGKTTFLKTLKETTSKRMVIVAPTGVAALNAGGVTIHSFFQVSFSPFVEGGTWASAVIAIVPRILIGIFPYFVYKLLQNRLGLALSGVLGAFTNTFFVLLGIYFLIPNFYTAGGKTLMATIFTTNSIAEMIIAGLLTVSITPMLLRLKK